MERRTDWALLLAGVVLFSFNTLAHCCPSVCQCSTKNGQVVVDCSGQSLITIPSNLPADTVHLNLEDNWIQEVSFVFQNDTRESLKNLQTLKLSKNSIQNIHENAFYNFSSLKVLDLSSNDLGQLTHGQLDGLKNLLQLNLRENMNLQFENTTFQDMDKLEILDLSQTGAFLNSVWLPTSLKELNLTANDYEELNISTIGHLQNLELLDLSNNNIAMVEIKDLQSLKVLNLSRNNIRSLSVSSLNNLPNLHMLVLDFNPISDILGPVFQTLINLHHLSLSHMANLEYLNQDVFQGLQHLLKLQMSNNPHLEFIHVSLFSDLVNAKVINISFNNITALHPIMFSAMREVIIDIKGNKLQCDCATEWIRSHENNSNIIFNNFANTKCFHNNRESLISNFDFKNLNCGEVKVNSNETNVKTKISGSIILQCDWQAETPLITWVTPRERRLYFFPSHALIERSHPSPDDVLSHGIYHIGHTWHNSSSYQSDLSENPERVVVLSNGNLFIDYMLRSDTGVYKCIVENSRNTSSVDITLYIDQSSLDNNMVWSLLVGLACAATFFTLNLIYVIISALVRRCINQRRREAIVKLVESMDTYKSAQLARLKENYYTQVNRIRDGYHNQLDRIRENYSSQSMRFKEGASQKREWASLKIDTIRDNYSSQVTRLKENSAQKLEHLRETYNNQLFRIRDYGSSQMARIHKKYKIKQRHVMKLLETMNFDNCRMIIDSECVRAESMIFETDLLHPDLGIPSPTLSESDAEYQTAESSNTTPNSSQLNINGEQTCLLNDDQQTMGEDITSQSMGDNSYLSRVDNSSQMREDSSEGENDVMFDCNELDQVLIQIHMIDESDDDTEKTPNSRNIDTCV